MLLQFGAIGVNFIPFFHFYSPSIFLLKAEAPKTTIIIIKDFGSINIADIITGSMTENHIIIYAPLFHCCF